MKSAFLTVRDRMLVTDVPTIRHRVWRGIESTSYTDGEPDFGFSGRAAYALGYDKPNYPVPSAVTSVVITADYVRIMNSDPLEGKLFIRD